MVTTEMIKDLREKTGCGMMDCKKALNENNGDFEKAIEFLRKKGLAAAAKRSDRVACQGVVESYIHNGNKIGVLVEVNSESDFVARNDDFHKFVKDIAMQIAASAPLYITKEEVPQEALDKEKEVLEAQAKESGKPAQAIAKIVEGRISKFYEEICLLEQPFIRDPKVKIRDLLAGLVAKIGENIVIRRFTRYQLGEKS
ncbi:translation elongation factor Ts [Candidatus Saganbacteria bacterium CG08_land_8_20_14_0_20_45_16]|uniref:Elongation factor Ts n=1 Tax=Candidatus Saganbacteria bacterium CG08_land_8_20_14_0_20_45_16 TaxID=2014293 RepID=A0A2H0XTZ9_UNCSA|nr:MAG: translation elongation factor Ts [Candidatus Saganbacteria bacterium CG08_land_8_20_14_0_20_45_16]